MSEDHDIEGQEFVERVGRLYLRLRSWLCSLHGAHGFRSDWSVGLHPEGPRLGVTVVALLSPEMVHKGN